jgi:hypothetical protein
MEVPADPSLLLQGFLLDLELDDPAVELIKRSSGLESTCMRSRVRPFDRLQFPLCACTSKRPVGTDRKSNEL